MTRPARAAAVTGAGLVVAPPGAAPDWFDVAANLGARGYRDLPPSGRYLLAAAKSALPGFGDLAGIPETDRAVSVGTNNAAGPLLDEMDREILGGRAETLGAALAPFFAVNVVSGRLSAEHGFKGFNLTVTSPAVAGVEALETGWRALGAGRAKVLLAGAMDDLDPAGRPVCEGAAVLALEDPAAAAARGARVLGHVRARTAFVPPATLGSCTGRDRAMSTIDDLIAAVSAGVAPDIHPVVDASPIADLALRAALVAGRGEHPLHESRTGGAGCVVPISVIAELLEEGRDGVVLVATATGGVAAVSYFAGTPEPTSGRTS